MKIIVANGNGGEKIKNIAQNKDNIICCNDINEIKTCMKLRNDIHRIVIFDAALVADDDRLVGSKLIDEINILYEKLEGTTNNLIIVTSYEDIAKTISTSCNGDILVILDGPKFSAVKLDMYVNNDILDIEKFRYNVNIETGDDCIQLEESSEEEVIDNFEDILINEDTENNEEATDSTNDDTDDADDDSIDEINYEDDYESKAVEFEEELEEEPVELEEEPVELEEEPVELEEDSEGNSDELNEELKELEKEYSEIDIETIEMESEEEPEELEEIESSTYKEKKGNKNKSSKGSLKIKNVIGRINKKEESKGQSSIELVSKKGYIMTFFGCGGQGTTTIAYNVACKLADMNYRVIYLDLDMTNRGGVLVSRDNFEALEYEDYKLISLLNTGNWENSIVGTTAGLSIAGIGIASDSASFANNVDESCIARSLGILKRQFNFIIIDCELTEAAEYAKDIINYSDSLGLVVDYSTWGIGKLVSKLYNINDDDISDIIFKKSNLIINRYREDREILGNKKCNADKFDSEIDNFTDAISRGTCDKFIRNNNGKSVIRYIDNADNCWMKSKPLIKISEEFSEDISDTINKLI